MYYDDPAAAVLDKARIYRDAANLFPAIRKTCAAFDNKVYNCRFTKALQDASGAYICTEKRYKWLELYIYDKGNRILLASVELEYMPDGKRIPADLLIESARAKREELLQRAAALEAIPEKAPAIKEQFRQLKKLVDALRDSIPYEARDAYRFDFRLTV